MKIYLQMILFVFSAAFAHGQSLTINPNSTLIMKGNVYLVIRNAALVNNGTLIDSAGTVDLSGHRDTTFSYIGGTKPISLFNLTVNKSGSGTALKSPVAVQNVLGVYSGILYPDSNLTLRSDSNLTARVDVVPAGANIIGKSIVERYFPKRRAWRLVTSPLSATTSIYDAWQNKGVYVPGWHTSVTGPNPTGSSGNGLDASPQNNASMKTWNYNTQLLEPVLNTHVPLSPGNDGNADNAGYFLFVRGDRTYNNFYLPNTNNTTLSSNGNLQVGQQNFTASATDGGYTLIGNPFASPIDFNAVSRTNLVKRFYVWDPSLSVVGAYVMLDDLDNDGIFTKSINASSQNNHLQSSQAFFVQTKVNGAAGISFPESAKSSGNNKGLFRPAPVTDGAGTSQSMRVVLNLKEADGSLIVTDGVLVECNSMYSDSIDLDDALKFGNINENLSLLKYNRTLAAERRPVLTENDTLFFKLIRTTQRKYEFQIEPVDINDPALLAWFEDSYMNTSIPLALNQTSAVEFMVDANPASSANDRFKIVFKRAIVLPVSIIAVNAVAEHADIVVNWTVDNEINISSYEVERSLDATHFSAIAVKQAAADNTTQHQYVITDENPVAGYNFYRIKYIDETGAAKYSSVVKVKMGEIMASSINIFPNPVENNTIHLQFNNYATCRYHVRLLSEAGHVLYEDNVENFSSNGSASIHPATHLPAATYLLEIVGESNKKITKKVIVSK
jgi:hypothetical protein